MNNFNSRIKVQIFIKSRFYKFIKNYLLIFILSLLNKIINFLIIFKISINIFVVNY